MCHGGRGSDVDVCRELVWHVQTWLSFYFSGTYTHKLLLAMWDLLEQLWPYFAVGIVASASISSLWSRDELASRFRRSSGMSIGSATLIGVVSPMPTYVAIPLVAVLYGAGVPAPPLFAFLVASPLMNPVLFALMAGAFGYQMALVLLVSAIVLGFSAGMILHACINRGHFRKFRPAQVSVAVLDRAEPLEAGKWRAFIKCFPNQLMKMTRFAGWLFLLGVFVAAAVKVLVPASWVIRMLGHEHSWSVLAAAAAGIPLYACGGGAIPVFKTLQDLGMDKGAILAFFISGPATKLSTLIALKAAVHIQVFLLYFAIALLGAVVFGLAYGAC
jgi:uncharacterized membrane protein YraQ (UPF0718 family)